MSEFYQSKYDQSNANNQFVDTVQSGANVTFNQNNFSENINQNIDDITKLINSLREKAQEFPQDEREQVLVHLDDLREDISKPEKQKPDRIKTRIIALITIAGTLFGGIANSADFCNNALELAEKVGIQIPIEISQPQRATHKLPPS
jgi:gas vesicle protein